jgi:predicted permease
LEKFAGTRLDAAASDEPMFETFWQDARHATRSLRRTPGVSAAAVLTLAIGIGATTAMFGVVDAVLINPLPFRDADRLTAIYSTTTTSRTDSLSYPNFLDLRESAKSFTAMTAWREHGYVLTGRSQPEAVTGQMISANYLAVLDLTPVAGRSFTADEDRRGGRPVAMLGERFWRARFHADPSIIGRTLTLDGVSYEIVGIVPSSVRLLRAHNTTRAADSFTDVFTPIGQFADPTFYDRRVNNDTQGVARLRDGVTLAQAREELDAISRGLAAKYPDANRNAGINVVDLRGDIVGETRPAILALGGAVLCVLLIACANVGNLILSRSLARRRELAVRAALGASPQQLARHVLVDGVVLAAAGGLIGVAIAAAGTRVVDRFMASALPRATDLRLDTTVLLFALAASCAAALLAGVIPALTAARSEAGAVRDAGRASTVRHHPAQRVFVVLQVALTMVLLVGMGLLLRSVATLLTVSPGFQPANVTAFYTGLASVGTKTPDEVREGIRALEARAASVTGVDSASAEFGALPFTGSSTLGVLPAGRAVPKDRMDDGYEALFYATGPSYFQTMQIPLLRGRSFNADDDAHHPNVVVVDEELARQLFRGEDPIGQRLTIPGIDHVMQIVGVVGHVKHWGLTRDDTAAVRGQLYFPYMQLPDILAPMAGTIVTIVVRSRVPSIVGPIRTELASINPTQAVAHERRMTDLIDDSLADRRFPMLLLTLFGGVALMLAVIGIYALTSYGVTQRTGEIGVRMALGARTGQVLRSVMLEGQQLTLAGIAIGAVAAALLTRALSGLLYGVSATDPLTFAGVALVMAFVTFAATLIPARRAAAIDPIVSLRAE